MKNIVMKNILWTLVFVFSAAGICSAQTVLYFPQFVDGNQPDTSVYWGTLMAVTNPAGLNTPPASVEVVVKRESGAVMDITFADDTGQPTSNTFQLAGGQTKFLFSPKVLALNTSVPYNVGYAIVTSNLAVSATSIFLEGNASGPFALAGVPASTPLNRQTIIASANAGLAAFNPSAATANIVFQFLDKSGTPIGSSVTRTLAANNHTAFFVSQLFPSVSPTTFGTMRITSDQGIVATALLFQNGAFGTIPIFPLP